VVPVGPGAGAAVLSALKANHVACLLSDRLVGQAAGVEVDFFGAKLRLPAGPVTLALRSGAPLLAAAIYYRSQPGLHRLVFRPPLDLQGLQGGFREQVRVGTQQLARELENLVLAAPTQWHLVQPNWPDDPPLRSFRERILPRRAVGGKASRATAWGGRRGG
jgi:lauroyl/myristoyl acyltransferase